MDKLLLKEIAKKLVAPGKGILAADESLGTIEKRFAKVGLENTEENRRSYREMLFTTPGIEKFLSGVILFSETFRHASRAQGKLLPDVLRERGILVGVKVDEGKEEKGGEFVTKGLDGLSARLQEYKKAGCVFTKWRAVTVIGQNLPTDEVLKENAKGLAEFAWVSQEAGLVPIVEPETLMDGEHTIERCEEATVRTLTEVFSAIERRGVDLGGMILKVNFVVSGHATSYAGRRAGEVARKTLRVLEKCVPYEVPGVVFLSGGLSPELATLYLNEVNKIKRESPWELSFSFGRALQGQALEAWRGKSENVLLAQKEFLERAKLASLARKGEYKKEDE